MDSNKTPLNSNSNVPNRGFTPDGAHSPASPGSGGPNNGGFNSGNRNNYNRKRKQRHFGPSQPTNPANQATKPVNAAGDNPNTPPRPNNSPAHAQGVPGGNNPPRQKPLYPQNAANPPRNPNAPYPSGPQQPRPQNRPINNNNGNNSGNINHTNTSAQGPGSRIIPPAGVPKPNAPIQNQPQQNDRPIRKWENRMVKIEETYDDIRKDNERIEKEIWLEIAEIHNAKLD